MKKIAIVTMCDDAKNYGAVLQAYALHKKIEQFGWSTEHLKIDIETFSNAVTDQKKTLSSIFKYSPIEFLGKVVGKFKNLYKRTYKSIYDRKAEKSVFLRKQAFENFESAQIPHSNALYDKKTIKNSLNLYDAFVTGSDQVWNPRWCNEVYRLDFVPKNIPKFSYAASVSVDVLTEEQQKQFEISLKNYIGVSVREKYTVNQLKPFSPVFPTHSLDPTLLLDREEWDKITDKKMIDKKYLFCYFLDTDKKLRRLAKRYAKKNNLIVVSIPYLMNEYNPFDKIYSDRLIESASPTTFISLIKYADTIFTDSFHATVFATIFKKNFFAFRRRGISGMNIRLQTLTEMFGTQKQFCDSDEKETIKYLSENSNTNYNSDEEYIEIKTMSEDYLKNMLNISEKMVNKL